MMAAAPDMSNYVSPRSKKGVRYMKSKDERSELVDGWRFGNGAGTSGAWATSPDQVTVSQHMLASLMELAEKVKRLRLVEIESGEPWECDSHIRRDEPGMLAHEVLRLFPAYSQLLDYIASLEPQAGMAERVMKALWPLLGGNHTEAELWCEIGEAVTAALDPEVRAIRRCATDPELVDRVIFAVRQSLQTRMPLHVSHARVDEVARDVGIAALNAALAQTQSQAQEPSDVKPSGIDRRYEAPESITSAHSDACMEEPTSDPDCPRCADVAAYRSTLSQAQENGK